MKFQLTSEEVDEILKGDEFLGIAFFANWSPPSIQIREVFSSLVEDLEQRSVYLLDADENEEIMRKLEIESVPAVYLSCRGRKEILKTSNVPHLVKTIHEFDKISKEKNLEERLGKLISKSRVMVFMKGSREKPFCGFSRRVIEIFNAHKIDYDTFNILEDEEVRQGLKEYSNWPTYPQIYVDSELIGGIDIIDELVEEGKLMEEFGYSL